MESRSCSRIWRGSTVWVISRMRSASVDFPWSMWAMIEKLRMRLWSTAMRGVEGSCWPLSPRVERDAVAAFRPGGAPVSGGCGLSRPPRST
jgi:hypothetical protein